MIQWLRSKPAASWLVLLGIVALLVISGCSRNAEQAKGPAPEQGQAVNPPPAGQPGSPETAPGQPAPGQAAPNQAVPSQAPSAQTAGNTAAPAAVHEPERRSAPAPVLPPPPPPPPKVYTVASGTKISVRTTTTISTKTAKDGEPFMATLAEPIVVDGKTLADRGSDAEGVVLKSDSGGKVKGVASVQVALKSIRLNDGRKVAINTSSFTQDAKSTKKKDAAKIGIGAGVGAAIGAIAGGGKGAAIGAGVGGGAGTAGVLLTKGDPAVIPSETLVAFTLKAPVQITEKK